MADRSESTDLTKSQVVQAPVEEADSEAKEEDTEAEASDSKEKRFHTTQIRRSSSTN